MKRFLGLIVLLLPFSAIAQVGGQTSSSLSNPYGGKLTAASTDCSVAQACAWMKLPTNAGSVSLTIGGTFVATIIAEQSGDGGNTFATVATYTTTQTAVVLHVSGMTDFRLRCSSFTSGTAFTNLQASNAGGTVSGTVNSVGPDAIGVASSTNPVQIGALSNNSGIVRQLVATEVLTGNRAALAIAPEQGRVLQNSSVTSAANTAVTTSIAGTGTQSVHLYKVSGFCSAAPTGTPSIVVKNGVAGTVIWQTEASATAVTADIREFLFTPALSNAPSAGMDIVLGACGVGLTGTLNVQASQF